MTTDTVLRSFAEFLTVSWNETSHLLRHVDQIDGVLGDWLQANWEVLVETVLLPGSSGFLEVYGDGADCNGASSRVFRPQARPTHGIYCMPVAGKQLRDLATGELLNPRDQTFWGFVHWDGITYDARPDFNAVLVEGEQNMVLDLREVEFQLDEIGASALCVGSNHSAQ